jgi:hypothetical protein
MGSKSAKGSDYVKIASHLFIKEYQRKEKDVPGVIYNKFITLLYRELKSGGTDIKLSHCWYRWGDIVVRYYTPYVRWNHDNPGETNVVWIGDEPSYKSNDKVIDLIKKNIAEFMIRHTGFEGHETAKDEVYEGAPFEFQVEYRKLRESLEKMRTNIPMDNPSKYISGLFYPAMKEFPKTEFKDIVNEKEKFESVFKLGLENNVSPADLYDLSEYFWYFFCYHLRLCKDKKCHENVTQETLNIWREEIPWETQRFEHILQNYAYEFHSRSGTDDALVKSLLNDRKERTERLEYLISKLCDDESEGRQ